jgi:exoribonuclease-2
MVFLQQNPEWAGSGKVVEMMDKRVTVIIPELALVTKLRLNKEAPLDSELHLAVREVDLPDVTAWFRVSG